jgi:pyrimidine deaminase RibD-like protein
VLAADRWPGGTVTDLKWMAETIVLSWRSPPSQTAFSVGALIVDASGEVLSEGWSRPQDPHDHAEEAAILALGENWTAPPGSTLYSSMEPCSTRASRPRSCTQLILAAGITRVVFAWREPTLFVEGRGAELLAAAGVEVVEVPQLAEAARAANRHLFAR